MTPDWQTFGTFTSGIGAVQPPYPSIWQGGDFLLLMVECDVGESVSTPSGWTIVTGAPQTTGASATSSKLYVFYRFSLAADNTAGPALSGPVDHSCAIIHGFRGVRTTGNPWDVIGTGVESVADTSISYPTATTTIVNTLVVSICSVGWDVSDTTFFNNDATNSNLQTLARRSGNTRSDGNGGGICVLTGEKGTAGAIGATTQTSTGSTYKAFMVIALAGAGPAAVVQPGQQMSMIRSNFF